MCVILARVRIPELVLKNAVLLDVCVVLVTTGRTVNTKLRVYLIPVSTEELALIQRLSIIIILMPIWCPPPRCTPMVISVNVHLVTLGRIVKMILVVIVIFMRNVWARSVNAKKVSMETGRVATKMSAIQTLVKILESVSKLVIAMIVTVPRDLLVLFAKADSTASQTLAKMMESVFLLYKHTHVHAKEDTRATIARKVTYAIPILVTMAEHVGRKVEMQFAHVLCNLKATAVKSTDVPNAENIPIVKMAAVPATMALLKQVINDAKWSQVEPRIHVRPTHVDMGVCVVRQFKEVFVNVQKDMMERTVN